jgi:putative holliday junction resolvase
MDLYTEQPRILALDHGLARIGIAISDPLGMIATGLPTLNLKQTPKLWAALQALIAPYSPLGAIVIGLPKHMNGTEGEQAKAARAFAEDWQNHMAPHVPPTVPIILWDERLTSRMAEQTLKDLGKKVGQHNKGDVDQLAAMRLLQEYLDAQHLQRARLAAMPPTDPTPDIAQA